jgi:hypothetical protein
MAIKFCKTAVRVEKWILLWIYDKSEKIIRKKQSKFTGKKSFSPHCNFA